MGEFNQPHLVKLPEPLVEAGIAHRHFLCCSIVDCTGRKVRTGTDRHVGDDVEQGPLGRRQGPDRGRELDEAGDLVRGEDVVLPDGRPPVPLGKQGALPDEVEPDPQVPGPHRLPHDEPEECVGDHVRVEAPADPFPEDRGDLLLPVGRKEDLPQLEDREHAGVQFLREFHVHGAHREDDAGPGTGEFLVEAEDGEEDAV